ncbi:GspH/FimT family pseudopilin [Paucibacter sp. R3-3]|uniref:Type II secretion system protein H n=1 Tax=Roseateles agri TaxID=3098619 RepID=A0ABU5DDI4_9BURK|nr:GspH/FimT family pseudopilin [Paucibacter sp. R3-3]MDY0744337.1 GspH/FimT family pseudopilin [Paucibacter sp. R3-3]
MMPAASAPIRLRQRGVNLIEVMVALIVMGLVLTQLVPYVAEWLQNLKLRNAAESMRGGIERARMESLRRNTNVTFWMVVDANSNVPGANCAVSSSSAAWVVSVGNPAGKCDTKPSMTDDLQLSSRSQALEVSSILSVSGVSSGNNSANHVTFNGLGQVVADGSNPIQVINVAPTSGNARPLRVVVQAGGAIRTCDPAVASDDPRVCPNL